MTEKITACRIFLKLALIAAVAVAVVAILSHAMSDQVLAELKHSLSMGTIIALIVLINLVSFLCFISLYAGYRWVRRDLKSPERDGLDS